MEYKTYIHLGELKSYTWKIYIYNEVWASSLKKLLDDKMIAL